MCTFKDLAEGYNAYFLHPYVLPNDRGLVCLISLVPADVNAKVPETSAGVYCALTDDGINWLQPYAAHVCKDFKNRAYDLPIADCFRFKDYVT